MIGNLALPLSQQPGPLMSFGQNTIAKNNTQFFLFADDYKGANQQFIDVMPWIVYGITDDLSIFINAPIAMKYQQGNQHSAGFEDLVLQLEDIVYTNTTSSFFDQATIVTNVTLPTGSATKQPATGFGSSTLFLGFTLSRMYVDWYLFTSNGVMLTTTHNHTKPGNEFFYQGGIGKNIANVNDWIFAWLVEGDGQYSQRDRTSGVSDTNSGGNIIYVTPSLWASSKKWIFQLGVGVPVVQNIYGNQGKNAYLVAASVGWTLG